VRVDRKSLGSFAGIVASVVFRGLAYMKLVDSRDRVACWESEGER
jgi:hypothetical protein